jgi:predicted nucleic acid-binding protein
VIVLDTTVLVYAVGADHALREPAQELLARVAAGRLRATTTPEVIQEFAHVRARRRDRRDAAGLAESCADILSPLLEVGEADLREGLRLFERTPALGALDAVLAAVALRAEATALISADQAFASVRGLRCPGLEGLDIERLQHG